MTDYTNRPKLYGTDEPSTSHHALAAGPLTVTLDNGRMRHIRWHGIELLCGIDYPVRDPNWTTVTVTTEKERIKQTDDRWAYNRKFVTVDGGLTGLLRASGRANGHMNVFVSFTATRDYETARSGFTMLHPADRLSGARIHVTHSSGHHEVVELPERISPSQPVFDISGLDYNISGANVRVTFHGDVFEMEDQRNWTDASFKTYCRPLSRPSPYRILAGKTVTQELDLYFSDDAHSPICQVDRTPITARVIYNDTPNSEKLPQISLALDAGSLPTPQEMETLGSLGCTRVNARIEDLSTARDVIGSIVAFGLPFDLEVVLDDDPTAAEEQLSAMAKELSSKGLSPEHILAVPNEFMKSHQPDGDWPTGLTPQDAVGLVRSVFPNTKTGCGALTNFTEFNRCPPRQTGCDFVSHSMTAIFHAADDTSVFETLASHPMIFKSAQTIAEGASYRLGLVSIGMRTNPYGPAPAANPTQVRTEAAGADPRQRGLFAAAWMVGAIASTLGHGIESMSLAMPVGPLGLVHRRAPWPQPLFDDGDRFVYPAYHVFNALCRLSHLDRLNIDLPKGAYGVACRKDGVITAVIANGSAEQIDIELQASNLVAILDEDSFDAATTNASWLSQVKGTDASILSLGSYAVAFVGFPNLVNGTTR